MPKLLEFPQEILSNIAENTVSDPDYNRDDALSNSSSSSGPHRVRGVLATLSTVSKELRAIAVPLLFRHIRVPESILVDLMRAENDPENIEIQSAISNAIDSLSKMHVASLARIIRMPFGDQGFRRFISQATCDDVLVPKLGQVIQACLKLRAIEDIHASFLPNATLIDAINIHPTIKEARVSNAQSSLLQPHLFPEISTSSPDTQLRKFHLSYRACHPVCTVEHFRSVLLYGMQVDSLILSPGSPIEYLSVPEYLLASNLTTIKDITLSQCDQISGLTGNLIAALEVRKSPNLKRLALRNMPQTTFLLSPNAHLGIPHALSTLEMGNKSSSLFSIESSDDDTRRRLICRELELTLALRKEPVSFSLPDILDGISSTFPSLGKLVLRLPSNFRFPDVYDSNWSLVLPEQDEDIIESLSKYRETTHLTLCCAQINIPRIQAMALKMAQHMPSLKHLRIEHTKSSSSEENSVDIAVNRETEGISVRLDIRCLGKLVKHATLA